jgi:hypothetical protein
MQRSPLARAAITSSTSMQRRMRSRLLRVVLLALLALPIIAAYTIGLSKMAQAAPQADDLSVVGPPSLDKTLVDAIFHRLHSPMEGNGAVIYSLSAQNHVDDAFALAVWWTETNDGEAGTGRAPAYNPGGVKNANYPHGSDGYSLYTDYAQAASDWFTIINQRYVSQGLTTVYQIAHPYVGTSTSSSWAAKVVNLMAGYQTEAKQSPAYLAAHDPPNLMKTPAPSKKQPTPQPGQQSSTPAQASRTSLGTLLLGLFIVLISVSVVIMLRRSLAKTDTNAVPRLASYHDDWQPPSFSTQNDGWEDIAGLPAQALETPLSRPSKEPAYTPGQHGPIASAEAATGTAHREIQGTLRPSRMPPLRPALPARPIVRNRLIPVKPDDASGQFASSGLRHYLPGEERGNHQAEEQE